MGRRPGARTAGREGTRVALLRAGTELFAERGFRGATAEIIARRARANKAMINYHFRSKKGLYEAILVATFGALAERVAAMPADGEGPPEQLRRFIRVFAQTAREHPSFPAMLLREMVSGGEHLGPEAFRRLGSVAGVVMEIVERGVREGTFRRVDPFMTHLTMVGSLAFFFGTAAFRRRAMAEVGLRLREPDAEAFVAHVEELVTHGLAASPAARGRRTA
jgi:AcrR family transcriptional regulator